MFGKVLIANRGEIALRVVRSCKELGIKSVAVYSDVDRESLHVAFADESVCIGPADSGKSYRNIKNIIAAAEIAQADAIHPGYGFLAENAEFARICEECGFTFIGPSSEHIEIMGNKSTAKKTMHKLGVPVVPGSDGPVKTINEGLELAKEIGFPVIIKASAGGGGKGMRIAGNDITFRNNFDLARGEAGQAFGNDEVYVEKYIESPRHIEVQVFGDHYGNALHFFERECSIQRRHQKLLEEAPSLGVSDKLRRRMGDISVAAVKALKYRNAGTVEYLLDKNGNFYFMEMNTRIQVEHPVTEMLTGIDLVKLQLSVAAGEEFSLKQKDIKMQGHAMECRINAEDSVTFRPFPGTITAYNAPGGYGVRVDSGAYNDYRVLPNYDSMIAKLIVLGKNRTEAIAIMRRALDEFIIHGINTSIPLHKKITEHFAFVDGTFSTDFIERYFA
ncbi:MAG: acetyl-CoA carboxylase biotin carboxylase subunit [Deferribacteraceae bacterium]|jgi:acetyl-CoA carboxylase biotin carboxylase subunit|nr:acetyl-CoA carboxylase biotin carboxylase subunit [Deferribacteraceae bacterium]